MSVSDQENGDLKEEAAAGASTPAPRSPEVQTAEKEERESPSDKTIEKKKYYVSIKRKDVETEEGEMKVETTESAEQEHLPLSFAKKKRPKTDVEIFWGKPNPKHSVGNCWCCD